MRTTIVVIGANFGDEGKGLIVDYFSTEKSMVVRTNGAAQAGHTVVTPDGRRHVFHHVAAGSFRGASTFLSEFFVVSPALFNQELLQLRDLGVDVLGKVIVSPSCPVTTPHDVMINMILEESRGEQRHGSCGVGMNETVTRSSRPDFQLWFGDLESVLGYETRLWELQQLWTELRLAELKLSPSDTWKRRLESRAIFDKFLEEWQKMAHDVITFDRPPDADLDDLIFEGAQGLLLDQSHRFFPHVTRSSTGLTNVDVLAKRWGVGHLDVTYVTRSYLTRHGRGPMPGYRPGMRFYDDTNVTNPWQESLKFGEISAPLMKETVDHDLKRTNLPVTARLAVTHLDQWGDRPFAEELAHHLEVKGLYTSSGPTRADVQVIA